MTSLGAGRLRIPPRSALAGVGVLVAAVAVAVWQPPLSCSTSTAAVLGLAGLAWWQRPSGRLRRRLGVSGWLGGRQWWGEASPWAARRIARTRTPLRGGGDDPRPLHRRCTARYGVRVGRVVSGRLPVRGLPVFSPWTRSGLLIGPPGSGKSSWLVDPIVDAPGAAYVSSTKTELITLTGRLRAGRGLVQVFNPTGLGGVASTFAWDPLSSCRDPAVADARARALVRGGGGASGQQAQFWAAKAAEIVRCYLLAAALAGEGMDQVMDWALAPEDRTPVSLLEAHPTEVPAGWVGTFERNLHAAPNERSGYLAAVVPAVAFVDNPLVAAACRPAPGAGLDVDAFLTGGAATLYVIAEDRRVAPLVTALTEAVFAAAKRLAAARAGGRLDPPLTMLLDEVANTTPVELDHWAADSRGAGITLWAVLQDLAQARARWGDTRAQTIFSNLPTKVVLPGVTQPKDLDALAYLAGQRRVCQTSESVSTATTARSSRSRSRQRSWTREPVVTGHLIYGLPRWHAYVLGLGSRAVVVRFRPGYRTVPMLLRRLAVPRGWQPVTPLGAPPAPRPSAPVVSMDQARAAHDRRRAS